MSLKEQLEFIKQKWTQLSREPGVFQYNLNTSRRYLPGKYKIVVELNPERTKLRRIPHVIPSLFTEFDSNKFNFNQIKASEKLLDIPFDDTIVSFIINQSPITIYHSLICPDLEKCLPQLITAKALEFCIEFLLSTNDRGFRIAFNSPGALASVNHLHLHLLLLDCDLYIDNVELETIGKSGAYRFTDAMPTEAICYIIDENNKKTIVEKIYDLVKFMLQNNVPHNIFITHDRSQGLSIRKLKVLIYAREKHFYIKDLTAINAATCEFSGYITARDSEMFNNLTEQKVLEKIKAETGNVYPLIYKYLNDL